MVAQKEMGLNYNQYSNFVIDYMLEYILFVYYLLKKYYLVKIIILQ